MVDVSKSPTLSAEMQEILSENSHLEYLSETGKIKCTLSGHEMPCDVKVLNSYLHGKKHKTLKAINDYNYDSYKQHLIDSTKNFPKNQLLCLLTSKYINNTAPSIQQHVNGRKFQKNFKTWEEFQKEGKEYVVLKKRRPNCEDKFESIKKKGNKKKSKYVEKDEEESDNDSLSDLYPKEEFEKNDKDHESVKKRKHDSKNNFERKKKKKVTMSD